MSDTDWNFEFEPMTLERTPKMHGEPKEEEQYPDVAPGWYRDCYLCGRNFEEKYMVRKEHIRKETVGKGWQATTHTTRYVISYCVWCQHSHLKP